MPDNLSLNNINPDTIDIDISGGGTGVTLPKADATANTAGLMPAADKEKVDEILTTTGIKNETSANNCEITMETGGTVITRDVGDGNVALVVNQKNTGSNGNIQTWQFNNVPKSYIKPDGSFKSDNGVNGSTIRVDAPNSSFVITASPTNGWARGLLVRNSTDTGDLACFAIYGTNSTSYLYGYMGASYNNATVKFNNIGLGVRLAGTTSPAYPLHVDIGTITGANVLAHFGQNGGFVKISNFSSFANTFLPLIQTQVANNSVAGLSFSAAGSNGYSSGAFTFNALNAGSSGAPTSGNIFSIQAFSVAKFAVDYTGAVKIANLAGTGTRMVTADSAGTLSAATEVSSGIYTPTITGSASTYTAQGFRYTQIGNVVQVGGIILVSGGALGQEVMKVSLPIPSSFTNDYDASGTVSGKYVGAPPTNSDLGNYIIADPPANGIFVYFYSVDTDTRICVEFSYIIQ